MEAKSDAESADRESVSCSFSQPLNHPHMRTSGGDFEDFGDDFPAEVYIEVFGGDAGVAPKLARGIGISKEIGFHKCHHRAADALVLVFLVGRHAANLPGGLRFPLALMKG